MVASLSVEVEALGAAGVVVVVETEAMTGTGTDSTPAEAAFESCVDASDDVSQVMAPSTHLVPAATEPMSVQLEPSQSAKVCSVRHLRVASFPRLTRRRPDLGRARLTARAWERDRRGCEKCDVAETEVAKGRARARTAVTKESEGMFFWGRLKERRRRGTSRLQ